MKNATTPATKADIAEVKAEIAVLKAEMATKKELEAAVTEMKQHFAVMVETMKHDFRDAFRDGYSSLRDRVSRLERVVGISA
jgi:hypothetical protein